MVEVLGWAAAIASVLVGLALLVVTLAPAFDRSKQPSRGELETLRQQVFGQREAEARMLFAQRHHQR